MSKKISVIMPTYNSERTIEESLKSIRSQIFNQNEVEILIVDGGSTDKTLEISKKYDCKILINKKKLPEFAKQLGFEKAEGEWGIFIDSDEMFLNRNSFLDRISLLEKNPNIKNLVSTGMACDERETDVNRYANCVGDPFSRFVYQYNGYNRMETMKKKFPHKKVDSGVIFSFKRAKYYPLYDALGNMFHIPTARKLYEENGRDQNFVANIFVNMVEKTKYAAMLCDDFVLHKPGMNKKTYMDKLKWRVKNNLFKKEGVGFSGRKDNSNYLKKRQYMYILYSATIIPVIIDSVKMSIKHNDRYLLNHFWWNEYVFFTIGFYVMCKVLNIPVKESKSYGKK